MSPPPLRSLPLSRPLLGVVFMLLAMLCFPAMGVLVKTLGAEGYPVTQVVWARYAFNLALVPLFFPRHPASYLRARRPYFQVIRGLLVLASTGCTFTALRFLPLAEVTAITFIAPLLVTALAALVLKEQVGRRRWIAVGIGFLGMIAIVRPGAAAFHWAALLPVLMACTYATYQILTRVTRADVDPVAAWFYMALVGAIGGTVLLPFGWTAPDLAGWTMLIAIAALGGIGHFCMIKAFERAEASAIAPLAYSELLWATMFGFLVFAEVPDAWTFVGAGTIVASGLYVAHRTRVRAGAG